MTNPRLLRYYSQELQHLREMGGEFAVQYPKIAGRLGLEGFECADPYVERLLEGFAFMAARSIAFSKRSLSCTFAASRPFLTITWAGMSRQ